MGGGGSFIVFGEDFENVAKFKYFGTALTNKACMHEEIKSRLNSKNACYHLVQNLYSFPICLLLCMGVWKLGLISGEEHKLRVFENRVLTEVCGPETEEETGEWRKLHDVELHVLCPLPNTICVIRSSRMRGGRACVL
jgi:hypothetical protein